MAESTCSDTSSEPTARSSGIAAAQAGGEHTVVQTSDGHLFSAGACGLGWCRTATSALAPLFGWRKVVLGSDEPASAFHASYYHNLAIGAASGALYSWGCGTFVDGNNDGVVPALGPADPAAAQETERPDLGGPPRPVPLPPPQTSLASPLSADGQQHHGTCGSPERAVALSGGAYHSIVLTDRGRVLTFGAGQLGQLGRRLTSDDNDNDTGGGGAIATDGAGLPVDATPAPVEAPQAPEFAAEGGVRAVGAGFYNTLVACRSGALYCSGENQNAQCGAGPANVHSMRRVDELRDAHVVHACGGYCHTLALTVAGAVLSLGCGDEGQRGDGKPGDADRAAVSTVPLPCRATAVAAGANHSVILGDDGHAYAFGSNEYGQLGLPPQEPQEEPAGDADECDAHVLAPTRIPMPPGSGRITGVSAGYAHTVLRDCDGHTYTFGQNENGQLGLGPQAVDVESVAEPQIVSVFTEPNKQ